MRAVLVVALLVPKFASAEPQLSLLAAEELRIPTTAPDVGYYWLDPDRAGDSPVGALALGAGIRIGRRWAVGLRGAVSWRRYRASDVGNMAFEVHSYDTVPIDVGGYLMCDAGRLLHHALWLSLWIARRYERVTDTDTFCIAPGGRDPSCGVPTKSTDWQDGERLVGVIAGVDVARIRSARVAALVDLQLGTGDGSAIAVGIGLRR